MGSPSGLLFYFKLEETMKMIKLLPIAPTLEIKKPEDKMLSDIFCDIRQYVDSELCAICLVEFSSELSADGATIEFYSTKESDELIYSRIKLGTGLKGNPELLVISYAHEIGHLEDIIMNFDSKLNAYSEVCGEPGNPEAELRGEDRAWLRSIDLLHRHKFALWSSFLDCVQSSLFTYVEEMMLSRQDQHRLLTSMMSRYQKKIDSLVLEPETSEREA
jgi:hypothetical protein